MSRKHRRSGIRGIAAMSRKLTNSQVRHIKTILLIERLTRAREGRTRRPNGLFDRIAERFGISRGMVKRIAKRERHKHIKVKPVEVRHYVS